jgi:hypothetical protein
MFLAEHNEKNVDNEPTEEKIRSGSTPRHYQNSRTERGLTLGITKDNKTGIRLLLPIEFETVVHLWLSLLGNEIN